MAEIFLMSFGYAPHGGYALCNAQLLPINTNQALFALLGTTYGGDGRVNFGLPDLRGRVPMHMGQGFNLGDHAGTETHTLSISELPTHFHYFGVSKNLPTTGVPTATSSLAQGIPGGAGAGVNMYTPDSTTNPSITLNPQSITNTGGNQAFTLLQPYTTLSYCIALQGIFPSQT